MRSNARLGKEKVVRIDRSETARGRARKKRKSAMSNLSEMDFRELHRIGWDLWDPVHFRSTTRPANRARHGLPDQTRQLKTSLLEPQDD